MPYFKVLGDVKTLLFNSDIMRSCCKVNITGLQYSSVTSDFSFLVGSDGTKSHFITSYELNKIQIKRFNLQDVKGDNYLKRYQLGLTSPIIDSESVLSNALLI